MHSPETPYIKSLPRNEKGRDWFVGDIKGELKLLESLLEAAAFDPSHDRLVSVGDLIDRGPDSMGVLKLFFASPWFYSVLGNHEAMTMYALMGERGGLEGLRRSGENWILQCSDELQNQVAEEFQNLPLALEITLADGRLCGVVHAEIPPYATWADVRQAVSSLEAANKDGGGIAMDLLWARTRCQIANDMTLWKPQVWDLVARRQARPYFDPTPGRDLIIAGHTALTVRQPLRLANWLFLHTGAGRPGGRLTLADTVTGELLQASSSSAIRRTRLPARLDTSAWRASSEELTEMT